MQDTKPDQKRKPSAINRQLRVGRVRELAIAFAMAVVDLVDDGSADDNEYRTDGPLPQGVTRRTLNSECRSGRVVARKEGREWICTRDAWHRARAKRPAPSLRLVPEPSKSDEERAREMILASGYRSAR